MNNNKNTYQMFKAFKHFTNDERKEKKNKVKSKVNITWLLSILASPLPYSLRTEGSALSMTPQLSLGVSLTGTTGAKVSLSPGLCFLVSLVMAGVVGAEEEGGSSALLLFVLTCRGRKL